MYPVGLSLVASTHIAYAIACIHRMLRMELYHLYRLDSGAADHMAQCRIVGTSKIRGTLMHASMAHKRGINL